MRRQQAPKSTLRTGFFGERGRGEKTLLLLCLEYRLDVAVPHEKLDTSIIAKVKPLLVVVIACFSLFL